MISTVLASISFDFDFTPLFIVLVIAWLVPIIVNLLRMDKIPTVILEIIAGYFIGRMFLKDYLPEDLKYLEFMALSGFMFLMFLSGLEIDVFQIMSSLPRKKLSLSHFFKNPLLLGVTVFASTLMLSYGAAVLIDMLIPLQNKWFFSLIMVTSSVGIIMPVLKNRGDTKSLFGQTVIMAAAVADIMSIILFIVTAYILRNGLQPELLLIILLFALFYVFYKIGKRLSGKSFVKKIRFKLSHSASQIQMRATILLILIFIVLAQFIGAEVMLLGAFLAGLLLSVFIQKDRSVLNLKLEALGYGFFIPIFFIMVGVEFDYEALKEFDKSFFFIFILLLITLYLVKLIPSLLFKNLFGWKKSLSGGFLLASRLSLIIAASKIGMDIGVISPGINASVIILAVVTCFASPIIFNMINPPSSQTGKKVIIVGGSSTGVLLLRRLEMHEKRSIIIESSRSRYEDLAAKGLHVTFSDGMDPETYAKLGLHKEDYVIVLTENEYKNGMVCEMLKEEFGHENIITRSPQSLKSEVNKKLNKYNIETFDTTRIVATTIENLILRPATYHTLVETFDRFSIEEVTLSNNSLDSKQLKDVPIHKDGFLILIKRQDDMLMPHGDTYLRLGDLITIFGTDTAIDSIKEKFS